MRDITPPLGLAKRSEGQVLTGTAVGLARQIGVDPWIVRLGLLVLSTASGFGLALYFALAAIVPKEEEVAEGTLTDQPASLHGAGTVALAVAGVLLVLRGTTLWIIDALSFSVLLAALGSGVVWTQASENERLAWGRALSSVGGERRAPVGVLGRLRIVAGVTLLITGIVSFVVNIGVSGGSGIISTLIAALVTLTGVALVVIPMFDRLATQIGAERRERIRSEERAEMAAHLHDSVLQTLALIQRSDDPVLVKKLARSQERELRTWLFGREPGIEATTIGEALRDAAGQVEDRFAVSIDVVLVADTDLDASTKAIVDAAKEAMVNAAKHAGVDSIDVFAEVTEADVTVFVRDEGCGFDLDTIADDRHGVRDSLIARMERHGGHAKIWSEPGEGSEVELLLPLGIKNETVDNEDRADDSDSVHNLTEETNGDRGKDTVEDHSE